VLLLLDRALRADRERCGDHRQAAARVAWVPLWASLKGMQVQRRALVMLVAALAAGGAASGALAGSAGTAPLHPLLPFARGQLKVLLGQGPSWQPVAGTPLTLTLFSGRPRPRVSAKTNAYITLQSPSQRCARSAKGDHHAQRLEIPSYYVATHLVTKTSIFTPGGGAAAGTYAVSLSGVIVSGVGSVRVCVWLANKPKVKTRPYSQTIPLIGGLFAASVSNVPALGISGSGAYALNAVYVARSFNYSVSTERCGTDEVDPAQSVAPGALAAESISLLRQPCAGDESVFSFTAPGRGALGSITYTATQAMTNPAGVGVLGGCELDPITVTKLSVATAYVVADGCKVGRLLVAPDDPTLPRGAVTEAQVDGGIAEVAPAGTTVDLVLNGVPVSSRSKKHH
jgi:hypothetical protein